MWIAVQRDVKKKQNKMEKEAEKVIFLTFIYQGELKTSLYFNYVKPSQCSYYEARKLY